MKTAWVSGLALSVALGLVVAACGSDDESLSNGSGGTGGATGGTGGATGGTGGATGGTGGATGGTGGATGGSGGATGGTGGATGGSGGATGGSGGATGGSGGATGGSGGATGGTGGATGGSAGAAGAAGGTGGTGGAACVDPMACPNTADWVCDVDSQTCTAGECTVGTGCGSGCTSATGCCLQQADGGPGTCYDLCSPYDAAYPCPGNLDCTSVDYGQTIGICFHAGVGQIGQACDPAGSADVLGINSGCVEGAFCLNDGTSDACYEKCGFFTSSPTCTAANSTCAVGGFCVDDPIVIDSAAIGGACDGTAEEGDLCAPRGDGYAGICVAYGGSTLTCLELCPINSTTYSCQGGATCADVFDAPFEGDVGLCLPPQPDCVDPTDCSNTTDWVCDVDTQTCAAGECTPGPNCGSGCTSATGCCLQQAEGGPGTCYDLCVPFDPNYPCPAGYACATVDYGQSIGICYREGQGQVGQACNPPPEADVMGINSGCVAGAICLGDGTTDGCFETCDFFGTTPNCTAPNENCNLAGYCTPPITIRAAAIGAKCVGGAKEGDPCAPRGDGYAGLCSDLGPGALTCAELCPLYKSYTCASGLTCSDVLPAPLADDVGLCQ